MKRLMFFATGFTFLLFAWAFAADPPASIVLTPPAKTAKITKMRAPGTILEITDVSLKIERKIKDKAETMEFILEKPVKFKVGDKVRVSYVEKDGQMIATRVIRTVNTQVKKPPRAATTPSRPAVPPSNPAAK